MLKNYPLSYDNLIKSINSGRGKDKSMQESFGIFKLYYSIIVGFISISMLLIA